MIRILLVEDSPLQRAVLADILGHAGDMLVVGEAADGLEAVREAERLRPDLILMDFHMPGLDGAGATRRIMEECPTPIVICSATLVPGDLEPGFEALRRGALAVVQKPVAPHVPGFDSLAGSLVRTVRLMSEVKVVRRWPERSAGAHPAGEAILRRRRIIAIGGSTGAPGVIAEILGSLAPALSIPVLVVQHMSNGFIDGFARWLGETARLPVSIADQGVRVQGGHVYLAPDDRHLGIAADGTLRLADDPPEHGFRPSVSYLLRSVASAYGAQAIGVVLSGMGTDGAEGLAMVRRQGGLTMVQDSASSVVFGMPGEAIRRNAAIHVLNPAALADTISAVLPVKETTR
ncbi:chemotaxis protein CheB [Zavarzinia sp. CC-PAN008]|uniref:chemotaxis protein CheB n=1 Tax=Zavarzinia sp. CC-PAN008 TaxID=3243332 RepID=UPI003F74354B